MRKRRPKVSAAHKMVYDAMAHKLQATYFTYSQSCAALALFERERELNKLRHFDFHIISITNIHTAYTHTHTHTTATTTVRLYGYGYVFRVRTIACNFCVDIGEQFVPLKAFFNFFKFCLFVQSDAFSMQIHTHTQLHK